MNLLLLIGYILLGISAAPSGEKISFLPGINFSINFDQYSGYLVASERKRFHYWFTYSQNSPSSDPLILWLNGGPGCSSLAGLIEELGPFKVGDNGNVLFENKYRWNKFASVVFIESPAAVGFSYDMDGNTVTGDDEVATNNYNAIVDFMNKFPEFRGRDFYITGESYGGVYLPTLGAKIINDKTHFPNFKGMAIGNGVLNWPSNYATMVPLYYYHSLVRQELWDNVRVNCCNGDILSCDIYSLFHDAKCRKPVLEILDGSNGLDTYNLYNTCYLDGNSGKRNTIENHLRRISGLPKRKIAGDSSLPLCAQTNNTGLYLNRRDVRVALHIPGLLPAWTECSDAVTNTYSSTHFDMTPEVQAISQSGARVLIYNGDVDTVCNHMQNRNFLNNLNRTILGPEMVNQPWFYNKETISIAGYVTKYSGDIDFVTVRGSGHFVPEDKPRESLQMIYNWIMKNDYSTPVPW